MDSPSESSASSLDNKVIEEDIRGIKRKLKKMHHLIHCMDSEGGRRIENVDQDLIQLQKEFKLGIMRNKQVFIRFLAELEIKVERLDLKVERLEMQGRPGTSS